MYSALNHIVCVRTSDIYPVTQTELGDVGLDPVTYRPKVGCLDRSHSSNEQNYLETTTLRFLIDNAESNRNRRILK